MAIHLHRASRRALDARALVATRNFGATSLLVITPAGRAEDPVSKVKFACEEDKTIDATFSDCVVAK